VIFGMMPAMTVAMMPISPGTDAKPFAPITMIGDLRTRIVEESTDPVTTHKELSVGFIYI